MGTFSLQTPGLMCGVFLLPMSVGLLDRTTVSGFVVETLLVAVLYGTTLEQIRRLWM